MALTYGCYITCYANVWHVTIGYSSKCVLLYTMCSQALEICKSLWSLSCGGVPNMPLVLSITFHFHLYINEVVCVQLAVHFSLGDWEDISIAHVIIIIKSEVSTLPIIIFSRGCVPEIFVTSYSVTYCIYIPGKSGFWFHYYCAEYDECKYSDTFWLADRVRLYITPSHYNHCANLSEDIELMKCLSDIFCQVCE